MQSLERIDVVLLELGEEVYEVFDFRWSCGVEIQRNLCIESFTEMFEGGDFQFRNTKPMLHSNPRRTHIGESICWGVWRPCGGGILHSGILDTQVRYDDVGVAHLTHVRIQCFEAVFTRIN